MWPSDDALLDAGFLADWRVLEVATVVEEAADLAVKTWRLLG